MPYKKRLTSWNKGLIGYRKGIKLSEKTKKKISRSHIGIRPSEKTRKKMSESHKGFIVPEETKIKISIALKGKKKPPFSEEHKKKIREVNLGKKLSKETKEKLKIAMTNRKHWWGNKISKSLRGKPNLNVRGKNHGLWKGGVTPINQKIRGSLEYKIWVFSIFSKNGFICQKCNRKGYKLVAHHIQNFAQYPELRFAIDNGITLCIVCHKLFHKIYGKKNNNELQIKKFISTKT